MGANNTIFCKEYTPDKQFDQLKIRLTSSGVVNIKVVTTLKKRDRLLTDQKSPGGRPAVISPMGPRVHTLTVHTQAAFLL